MSARDQTDLLARAAAAVGDRGTARRCLPLLDLTSLNESDTEADIGALCRRARRHGVAAVCIYPRFLRLARTELADSGVRLATVANFPDGSDDLARAVDEAAAALADGADEIDLVIPIEAVLAGDIAAATEMVEAVRACAPGALLKVILETGRLASADRIAAAARAAVMAGADMLKTSTGKLTPGATLDATAVLLAVCAEAGGRVGCKAAGGIRTVGQAAGYLVLADTLLGAEWARPATFRFGASALLDDILGRLDRT
jgi:deoxyribose-phosphate aldolase